MASYVFDPAPRFRALTWQMPLLSLSMRLSIIACIISVIIATNAFLLTSSTGALGLAMAFTGLAMLLILARTYARSTIIQGPPRPISDLTDGDNLANSLSYDLAVALKGLPDSTRATSAQLFRSLYQSSPYIRDLCLRLELPLETTVTKLMHLAPQPLDISQLLQQALAASQKRQGQAVRPGDCIGVLLTHEKLGTFLRQQHLQAKDVSTVLHRYHWLEDQKQQRQLWWQPQHLLAFTGFGRSFAAGFTTFVDRFARLPHGQIWDAIDGHESELDQLITSLARERQSNVLLVGSPGAGTYGLIKELYQRIQHNHAHPTLNGQRLLYIHLAQIATLGTTPSEQQALVTRALNEMEQAGNIIVVLDGISSILSQTPGGLNAGQALTPFLSSPAVRVITLISPDDFRQTVEPHPDLLEYFEVIDVPPLSASATLRLLVRTIGAWEHRYGVFVPYRTLRELVRQSQHILPFVPFPEKAFDLLEDAVASEQGNGEGIITPQDIQRIISQKVNVNVGDISASESDRLLRLEDVMHQRVINQRAAITAVARTMVRARAGTRHPNKPIGSFLFLGPTGVGKTETAKALAHAYYGSDKRLQRLDMTQFTGSVGVERLLGSGIITGQLTSIIAANPFSVLLLDEFEKADALVQQLFMPILDEGYVTDSSGRKYSFSNTIIIATSNAGAEYIRQQIGDSGTAPDGFADGLREHVLSSGIFKPELLNRFDGVITFTPLSRSHIEEIAALMLRHLNKRLDANHGVTVAITPELVQFLSEIGYDPDFGARPMARAIQDTVEYAIAEQITRGITKPGQAITLHLDSLRQLQTTTA